MPTNLLKQQTDTRLTQAVLRALAFFEIYRMPVERERLYELVDVKASRLEFEQEVNRMIHDRLIVGSKGLVALSRWDESAHNARLIEIARKKQKAFNYYGWFALLPYVRQLSFINSIAVGNADQESDIDFFVVTAPRKLYFVRSVIIILFRLLGVYKTRTIIADQFCFGFYVSQNKLNLESLLLKPSDPYFVHWLASMQPLLGRKYYLKLIQANNWIYDYLPNWEAEQRLQILKSPHVLMRLIKSLLEILLWLPTEIIEPILRFIHIRHTFNLPENLSKTSTTVANMHMLKLHAADVRRDVAEKYTAAIKNHK